MARHITWTRQALLPFCLLMLLSPALAAQSISIEGDSASTPPLGSPPVAGFVDDTIDGPIRTPGPPPGMGLMACEEGACFQTFASAPALKGHVDGVTLVNGHAELLGWACSPQWLPPIDVHLYLGGPAGIGLFAGGFKADKPSEPGVGAWCGLTGSNYRFVIGLTEGLRMAHGGTLIYVHGISPLGAPNALLGNSGVKTVPPVPGIIKASPNPCTIPWGATTCATTLTWGSPAADAEVWITNPSGTNPQLVARSQNGTKLIDWILAGGGRFHLKTGGWNGTTLATVDVRGTPTVNSPPTVSLTAPANGQQVVEGSTLTLAASAADTDDAVARVEFLVDGVKVGEDASPPYTFAWAAVLGQHSVAARAFDTRGAQTTSASANITVSPPAPPSIGDGGAAAVVPDPLSDSVGATAAEFRVDESGAATYAIPLYAVPGTAGVTPKLSLRYSSQGGDGPLGRGWSIGGLSSITRCRATREAGDFIVGGVATDGTPSPINFTASDRYCLDGQRLIPAPANAAACRAVGGMGALNLRTELESFQRVCAYTPLGGTHGVAFFTVERPDGSISWYGDRDQDATANRPDGYVNSTAPGKTAFALSWAQTRFQDSTGNYIDTTYFEDPATGEHLPLEVRYTGRVALPGQSTGAAAPFAKVMFTYAWQAEAQWRQGYVAGGVVSQRRRLAHIITCDSAAAGCGTSLQARYYHLTYGTSTSGSGAELLTQVQECRDSSRVACLAPTTFAWSNASNTLASASSWDPGYFGSTAKFEGFKLGDIDGDGRQDLVWLKDGASGETCPTEHVMVSFGELDGAGRQGFSAPVLAGCTPNELMSGLGEGSWQLFDYTGDGRDDLFVAGNGAWKLHASQGRTAQPFNTSVDLLAGIPIPVQVTTYAGFHPQLPDLNGDGLLDVVYLSNGLRARLMERVGGSWRWGAERQVTFVSEPPPACPPEAIDGCRTDPPQLHDPQRFGLNDFDGDAASDLIFSVVTHWKERCDDDPETCGRPVLNVSMPQTYTYGVSQLTATTVEFKRQSAIPLDLGLNGRTVLGDFNGDGLTDVATGGSMGGSVPWRYSLNSGAGFLPPVALGTLPNPDLVKAADVNGDGRSDLLFVQPDSYGVPRYSVRRALPGGGFAAADVLPGAQACFGTGCDPRAAVNLFTDLDGDGGLDYFALRVFSLDSATFFVAQPEAGSRGKPRDAIVAIANGLGARTELTYAALNNRGIHLRDSGSRDTATWGRGAPVRDFTGPLYVVAQAASSSPQSGAPDAMARLYYRYAGAKMQAGGRGFLGFREIATIDPNRAGGYVVTTTGYAQNFPYAGMPVETVKAVASGAYVPSACIASPIANACYAVPGTTFGSLGGSWFSAQTQVWEADTDSAGAATVAFAPGVQAPVHVRTAGTEERQRDPFLGVQTGRIVTTFGYGSHGNVASTTVDTFEGTSGTSLASVMTANTYGDNAASWRLGRLTATTVTHRRPGLPDVVRSTAFEYAMGGAATGLLTAERQQPGTPLELRKQTTYDDFGNRIAATTCAAPATCAGTLDFQPAHPETVQRYARTTFDARGRYPVATVEPFGDGEHATQTVFARDRFGEVLHARDANGVDTLAIPGALGRAYYTWVETVPGSALGAGEGGAERLTTYRWCGTGTTCPTGARFRSRTVAEGAPTTWTYYDLLGRPILQVTETFNAGVAGQDLSGVCTAYDASGNPVRVSNPFFLPGTAGGMDAAALANQCSIGARAWTVTAYDTLGRPTDVQSPDGAIISTGHAGLRTLVTDARGHTTTETRNAKGELVAVTDAEGFTQTFGYHADGSLAETVRDAGGGTIVNAFAYNALGQKVSQSDPDSGLTTFGYNALGELLVQQDAAGNRIEQALDGRGRVWRRTVRQADGSIESLSTFEFDAAGAVGALAREAVAGTYATIAGTHAAQAGQGGPLDFARSYRYDGLGRPIGTTTTIDGVDYTAAVQYDALGRAAKMQDASGRWSRTEFSGRGMAAAVCDSSAGDGAAKCPDSADTVLRTLATDVWGKPVRERRGHSAAMEVVRTHRGDNGRLATLCAGNAGCHLLREEYAWDAAGNLQSHLKDGRYLETFEYDRLGRLVRSTASGSATYAAEYDALGNPCRKTFDGEMRTLTYAGRAGCGAGGSLGNATGPHQVAQVQLGNETAHYHYDLRGNQTVRDLPGTAQDRTIHYTADNRAHEIVLGNGLRTRFWYGSDGQRYKREDGGKRTLYLGNVEIVIDGGVTTTRRMVGGVLMQTIVGGAATSRHLFHDRLGNVVAVTDGAGALVERHDFQPFGERRDPTQPGAITSVGSNVTTRGFTGHEMVDGLGVIHMNGRIHDPQLGRFLQPDPVIQTPGNPQGWNAYTYVFNNPLAYTDPSGMIGIKERQWAAAAVTVVAAVVAPYVTPYVAPVVYAAGTGAIAGGIATGSTKGAVYGAFSAGMFYGIGTYFQNAQWAQATTSGAFGSGLTWGAYGAKVLAHGAAGGVMANLQGGRFGDGFVSAGVAQAFAPGIDGIGSAAGRVTAAAILGGAVSELSGGKFANGALTAAFARAFNDDLHRRVPISPEESAMLRNEDLQGFWDSRLERGDPWGRIGASIWSPGNSSLSAKDLALADATTVRLIDAMADRDGLQISGLSPGEVLRYMGFHYNTELRQIGLGVARGHARLVGGLGGSTVGLKATADMHHVIFDAHELPPTTYGGTPIFGGLMPGWESRQVNRLVNFCNGCPE